MALTSESDAAETGAIADDSAPVETTQSGGLPARAFISLPVEQAQRLARNNGQSSRVVRIDGEGQPITLDIQPGRLNFTVEDGIVVDVAEEGAFSDTMLLAWPSEVFFTEQFTEVSTAYAERCAWRLHDDTGAEYLEEVDDIAVEDVSRLLDAIDCEGSLSIRWNGEVAIAEASEDAIERIETLRPYLPFEIEIFR